MKRCFVHKYMRTFFATGALLVVSIVSFAQDYKFGDYVPARNTNGIYGYKRYGGDSHTFVIKPRFSMAKPFSEGLASVCIDGKYGCIDTDGKCVIPYRFEYLGSFSEGLAVAKINGKYGYIDKTGKSVIPYRFDLASEFSDGLAPIQLNGEWKYIDKDGKMYASRDAVRNSYTSFAKQYVEVFVNNWQKKGKFEKTDDWKKRVNESTRRCMIDSLLQVARKEFIAEQSNGLKTRQNILEYDADGEIFLIYDDRFGNLLVPVPISQAENFENNFASVSRTNTYYIAEDHLALQSADFTTPDGHKYSYKNDAPLEFTSVDIAYNFDSIDVEAVDEGGKNHGKPQFSRKSLKVGNSDVDMGIPMSGVVNDNTFAVIIANENYQSVSEVDYAANDGRVFKEYCVKTLGIPEKNIHFTPDATLVNMWSQVDWLTNIAQACNGDASLIFYYAGHGIPDEGSRDAYLLPVDGNGTNTRTAYKLSDLYSSLSQYPTKQTLVLLDACFSGAERSGNMLASARGVALKAKEAVPTGNLVVLSAASGDETAYQYADKGHGLFTYFLLKKLQETKGNVSLGELAAYVEEQVSRYSIIENSKRQTPTVIPSAGLSVDWKKLNLCR